MDTMPIFHKKPSLTTPNKLLPSLLNHFIYLFRYIYYLFVDTPELSRNAHIPPQHTKAAPT